MTSTRKIPTWLYPLLWVGFGAYLLLVTYIVFAARRRQLHTPDEFRTFANFTPLKHLLAIKNVKHFTGQVIYDFIENVFGNIALFMPLPAFLRILLNIKSDRVIIFIALLGSAAIETLQYLIGVGIADVDDILLNTFGALLGLIIVNRAWKIS